MCAACFVDYDNYDEYLMLCLAENALSIWIVFAYVTLRLLMLLSGMVCEHKLLLCIHFFADFCQAAKTFV